MAHTPVLIADVVVEALRNVDPGKIELSKVRYDGRPPAERPMYQERTFAYEFYHQLRMLQENTRSEELQGVTQQAEVSKRYQGVPFMPDLLLHVPGETMNLAAFEFKLAENQNLRRDLFKLQHLKSDYGYNEVFMIILGSEEAAESWLARAKEFQSSEGEDIQFIVYDPNGEDRVSRRESFRIKVPE